MRRERVAASYRAVLEDVAPDACHELDEQMIQMGQRWVVPRVVTWADDDWLSAEQVADYAGVSIATAYSWRQRGLPSIPSNEGLRFQFSEVRRWTSGQRGES
jgi:hypothetical protein